MSLGDRAVGVVVLLSGILIILAARTTATLLPICFGLVVLSFVLERIPYQAVWKVMPVTLLIAFPCVFGFLSSAWAANPGTTASHTAIALSMIVQAHVLTTWLNLQNDVRIRHAAFWFVIGVAVGLAILSFEVFSHQYLRRMIIETFEILSPPTLNKHFSISKSGDLTIQGFELNRCIAALNFMLWPALLCAAVLWSGRKFAIIAVVLWLVSLAATYGSPHETSKIAILFGLAIFVLAKYWLRAAHIAVVAIWCLLILGIVPMSMIAYNQFELHKSSWLQRTARERIIIWSDIAERVLEAPVMGVGARTGYVLSEKLVASTKQPEPKKQRSIARHAHNAYVQMWFELGLVGAVLTLVGGLAVIGAITRLPFAAQPFGFATFAVFMTEVASSWEIWQRWFFALFVLTAVAFALGDRAMRDATSPKGPPAP